MDEKRFTRSEDQVSGLSDQVSSLAKIVVELQTEIKKYTYKRDYVARIFALVVIVTTIAGLAVIQQQSTAISHRAALANCNALNDALRNERALYQTLAASERQIIPKTVAEVAAQQARVQALTTAANAIRIVNCDQQVA